MGFFNVMVAQIQIECEARGIEATVDCFEGSYFSKNCKQNGLEILALPCLTLGGSCNLCLRNMS
jgi:hypothetical protein